MKRKEKKEKKKKKRRKKGRKKINSKEMLNTSIVMNALGICRTHITYHIYRLSHKIQSYNGKQVETKAMEW